MNLWIAKEHNGLVWLYRGEPEWDEVRKTWDGVDIWCFSGEAFPIPIEPGQKKRVKIVEATDD